MRKAQALSFIYILLLSIFVYLTSANQCFAKESAAEGAAENESEQSRDEYMEENYFEHTQLRFMLGADVGHVGFLFADKTEIPNTSTGTAGFNIGADISYSWLSGVGLSARLDYSAMWRREKGDFEIKDNFDVLSIEGYLKYTFHPYYTLWIYLGIGIGFTFTDGYMPEDHCWGYDHFKIPAELGFEWNLTERLFMGVRLNLAIAGLFSNPYRTDWKPALTIGYAL